MLGRPGERRLPVAAVSRRLAASPRPRPARRLQLASSAALAQPANPTRRPPPSRLPAPCDSPAPRSTAGLAQPPPPAAQAEQQPLRRRLQRAVDDRRALQVLTQHRDAPSRTTAARRPQRTSTTPHTQRRPGELAPRRTRTPADAPRWLILPRVPCRLRCDGLVRLSPDDGKTRTAIEIA